MEYSGAGNAEALLQMYKGLIDIQSHITPPFGQYYIMNKLLRYSGVYEA